MKKKSQFCKSSEFQVVSSYGGENGVPGVFFTYEMSPLQISYKESKRYLLNYTLLHCYRMRI